MVRAAHNRSLFNDETLDEDGLTEYERAFLSTPFSQLSVDDRMSAIAIKDKQNRVRAIANEAYRKQKQEDEKNELYGGKK